MNQKLTLSLILFCAMTNDLLGQLPPSPTSETVSCYEDIVLPTPPDVSDSCGNPLTPTGPVEGTLPSCEGEVTYTWSYSGCNDESGDYVHTVTIDLPAPIAPTHDSETVNCYADIVLPDPPTVQDACGTPMAITGPVESVPPACEGDVTYTWTYTDCAGQTVDYVHTVTIDIPAPTPPAPTSITIACYGDIVLPEPPEVLDVCGTPVTPTGPVEGGVPGCESNITYTWTYADCAGNEVEYVQTVNTVPDVPENPIPKITNASANTEYTDTQGWTHYLKSDGMGNDTILLSINKNGQDIGSVGDETFEVRVEKNSGVVDVGEFFREHAPGLGQITEALALNYFWEVTPNYASPTASADTFSLRFYLSDEDVEALSAAMGGNLAADDLLFFKASHNEVGFPCDDFSSIEAADVQIFTNDAFKSTEQWSLEDFGTSAIIGTMDIVGFSCGGLFAVRLVNPVKEISSLEKITLMPNPSAGEISLSFRAKRKENLHLSIFNSLGKLVHQEQSVAFQGFNKIRLQLDHLWPGVYFLRLQNEKGELASRQFVLVR